MKVGDLIRCSYNGGSWLGWVLEVSLGRWTGSPKVMTVWRPSCAVKIQTFSADSFYELEVVR